MQHQIGGGRIYVEHGKLQQIAWRCGDQPFRRRIQTLAPSAPAERQEDPVADGPALDLLAQRGDLTEPFVARDRRQRRQGAVVAADGQQVRGVDRGRAHADRDFCALGPRQIDVDDLDDFRGIAMTGELDGFHGRLLRLRVALV